MFNIKTGKKASPAAGHCLLSVINERECKRVTFINECYDDIRNLKLLTSQMRALSRKTNLKMQTRLHSWKVSMITLPIEGFVRGDGHNISTNTWTSWVCAPWQNNLNYNQKFSDQFVLSGENWSKESWQHHNRWNIFPSKLYSTNLT